MVFIFTPSKIANPGRSQKMLSLIATGMVRGVSPGSRSAVRMSTKAGAIKFDMNFSANWFAGSTSNLAAAAPSAYGQTLTTAIAQCGRDGGFQERDAATRFVKKVFPSATVTATQTKERPIVVRIAYQGEEIISVPQRDLFGK